MKKPTSYSPEELLELLQTQQVTIVKMAEQIDQLQQRIAQLLHLLYGTKSEKTPKPKDISQTTVSSAFAPTLLPPNNKKPTPTGANGRRPLPKDLPRVRVEHDVSEQQRGCQCCHRKMSRMGKVITEQLEFKPSELYVIEHVRYKYGCQRCKQGIITAELPPQPIEKGLAGPGLITEIIINKYCDHLPLHRQEQRFARLGIDLPRSTLCDWIMQGGSLLKPLVTEMKVDTLLPSKRIFTDDTPTPVQNKGKTHQGRLWVYVGGGNDKPNCVIYEYTSSRSQTAPQKFLKGYKGYLQADAYAGYDILYKTRDVIEVACWAHARRKFMDIIKAAKEPSLADKAVEYIGKLYEVERRGKPLTPLQRKYLRRKYSKPILRHFYRWLIRRQKETLPKSPIGKAIAYALNHWRALNNYLRNGILEIDNNTAERAIKPVVLGRKNWLFAGSEEGAKNAAVLYSLIETCKLNGINPFAYLKDVLTRLPTTLMKDIKQLLPYNWKPDI